MIMSRSVHVAANGLISLLFMANILMCVCMRERERDIFFIHSSVDGHLGCFLVLALVNSAALNIKVHVSF